MTLVLRLGNRIRQWQLDRQLDTDEAAGKIGLPLDRYVELKTLGRATPEEIEKIVAATGISKKWLEDWANRPNQPKVTVIAARM